MIATFDGKPVWVPATTVAILERAAAERPDATALVCGDETLTYRAYLDRVLIVAGALVARGANGRHVAIVLPNGIDIAVAIFAAQAAGAASASLNPDYTRGELSKLLTRIDPAVTITSSELAGSLKTLAQDADTVMTVRELASDRSTTSPLGLTPDSIAVLQFTGGTTGVPKAAMLSHRAVATNVAQREAVLPTMPGDERIVCMMPLYHSFAAAMCLHLAAYAGGALHILPRYRPDWVMDCIAKHSITRLPAGPTVFNSLLGFDGLKRDALASVRCAYSGSAPLALDTLDRWHQRTGVPIYEGYGQSEAGPILTYHGPNMKLKQGSVGPPLPETQVAIAGGQKVGEIIARGPQIMNGYLNSRAATIATLVDGWLYTGDIGRMDEQGYVFIEDRKKDMAIVGGFNVYPREIDEALMSLPAVSESGTIGVPDPYRGEVIWSFVSGDATSEAVAAHCESRLVKYKRPTRIIVQPSLPKTNVGKIDKQALRTLARTILESETRVA